MSAWLLSIVGVVSLGVLLEILLEDGETSKYIKGVFSIAVVLVIVAPLPAFFNKDWNYESFFGSELHEPDNEFVENINNTQLDAVEKYIIGKLKDDGFDVSSVDIKYKPNTREIAKVDVWTIGIDDAKNIIECVVKNINVDRKFVTVYNQSG